MAPFYLAVGEDLMRTLRFPFQVSGLLDSSIHPPLFGICEAIWLRDQAVSVFSRALPQMRLNRLASCGGAGPHPRPRNRP